MEKEVVKIDFSNEEISLIKSQIAPKATDNELKLFIYQAKRTGLDPLARQIYAIHRWNSAQNKEVMTIQTSIDGFRVVAERTGDYGGQDEPIFDETFEGGIIKCSVTIYRFRNDVRYPAAVGVAYWNEYVQTDKNGNPSGLWKKMPHVMISKVAEAIALRKAYPQDLSGLYTGDEMEQSDSETIPEPVPKEMERAKKNGLSKTKKGLSEDELQQWQQSLTDCVNITELTLLYNKNAGVVNSEPQVFEMFKARKKQLS
jgi:phage recombination protein Bet